MSKEICASRFFCKVCIKNPGHKGDHKSIDGTIWLSYEKGAYKTN